MPFGSSSRADSLDASFFASLPPLEAARPAPAGASQSLFEGLAALKQSGGASKQLYRLALMDPATGRPAAYPSDDDLAALIMGGSPRLPAEPAQAPAARQQPSSSGAREPSFQELLAATHSKGGPICAHCGVW